MSAGDPLATWRGRRVLVTGHTGFKGAWLSLLLSELGADVTGVGLAPEHLDCAYLRARVNERVTNHVLDVRDTDRMARVIVDSRPDAIFHLAAQALVPRGYRDPVETYDINVMGTASLLAACERSGVFGADSSGRRVAVLVVTSDKVYANDGSGRAFVESDPLGGADPYSSSKAAAELFVESWRYRLGADEACLATARAGNVIGGGDQAEGRLLPDAYRALLAGRPVAVRNPNAVRPWQFVLEPLVGYLCYADRLLAGDSVPRSLNFGPDAAAARPVHEVLSMLVEQWGSGSWVPTDVRPGPEAKFLSLDASLASRSLGWRPRLDLAEALSWTTEWYRAAAEDGDCVSLAVDQIKRYRYLLAA
jgi:CDP-glucose 4,6-dehydratase